MTGPRDPMPQEPPVEAWIAAPAGAAPARRPLALALRAAGPVAAILLLWEGAVRAFALPPYLLPGPAAVARAFWTNRAQIGTETLRTLTEMLAGFAIGTAGGLVLALAMVASTRLRSLLRPVLVISQTIPVFALAPLLTLWLGFGMAPKIAVTVLIVLMPVASAAFDGMMATPQAMLDLSRTMGASRLRELRHLRLPAARPSLASGLRLAAIYAPVGAVIGEWVGGSRGLGALMIHANGRMKIDLVFAALVALCLMTLIFARGVDAACRRWLDAR